MGDSFAIPVKSDKAFARTVQDKCVERRQNLRRELDNIYKSIIEDITHHKRRRHNVRDLFEEGKNIFYFVVGMCFIFKNANAESSLRNTAESKFLYLLHLFTFNFT